jgi:hypothetical protein
LHPAHIDVAANKNISPISFFLQCFVSKQSKNYEQHIRVT